MLVRLLPDGGERAGELSSIYAFDSMIDWLTFVAPFPHPEPINGGQVLSIAPGGEVEWQTSKRFGLRGSYDVHLQVRTCPRSETYCGALEISGNPVKWFQGHNLWGTDDLPSLVVATLEAVAHQLGIEVTDATRALWLAGKVRLQRVDYTESFHLANLGEVIAWIRAADRTAHLRHRGGGHLKGNTLYFGKNSRRWTLKLYAKGDEIRARGRDPGELLKLPAIRDWADRSLRVELTLRSMELKDRRLANVSDWLPIDGVPFEHPGRSALHHVLGNLTMTTTSGIPSDVLDQLTPAQRVAYVAWEGGADLRTVLPKRSFYRLRSVLVPHGIDISHTRPATVTNIVPLHRVLEAKPAPTPDWAYGTKLYFEPPRLVG